jgi:hypothetical protein
MTQKQFIDKVKYRATMSGKLNVNFDLDAIVDIIETSVEEFHENDDRANSEMYLIIRKDYYENTKEFSCNRTMLLPKNVKAVLSTKRSEQQFRTMTNGSLFFGNDGDVISGGGAGNGIASMTYGEKAFSGATTFLAMASYSNFVSQLYLDTVAYDFSEYTHKLTILGGDLRSDLILNVAVLNDYEAMYEMKDFQDYVVGKVWEDFTIIATFVETKLMGGYKIDLSRLDKKGQKLIDRVEKKWVDQLGEADFITMW